MRPQFGINPANRAVCSSCATVYRFDHFVKTGLFREVPYSEWTHMNSETLALKGYHAYGKTTEFKNYRGDPMPKFEELPPKIQAAWTAFAARVQKGGTVEEGYEAYGNVVEWKNFEGKPIPKYNEPPMTDKIVEAWKAAHTCIHGLVEPPTPSDVSLANE